MVDAGAYRFIENDLLPAALVWDALELPTACYDWQCKGQCEGPHNCYVVKDVYGNNRGCVPTAPPRCACDASFMVGGRTEHSHNHPVYTQRPANPWRAGASWRCRFPSDRSHAR